MGHTGIQYRSDFARQLQPSEAIPNVQPDESEPESEMEQVPDVVENETPTPPENTQQSEIIDERIPTNL